MRASLSTTTILLHTIKLITLLVEVNCIPCEVRITHIYFGLNGVCIHLVQGLTEGKQKRRNKEFSSICSLGTGLSVTKRIIKKQNWQTGANDTQYWADKLTLERLRHRCEDNIKVWIERKPTRCNNQMFIIKFCLNMFRALLYPSSGEQRPCYCIWCTVLVLLDVVGSGCGALCVVGCELCSHPTTQRPTTATNHIQQNQNNTPNAVTGPLFSWRWA